jgi:hypothetical protein
VASFLVAEAVAEKTAYRAAINSSASATPTILTPWYLPTEYKGRSPASRAASAVPITLSHILRLCLLP